MNGRNRILAAAMLAAAHTEERVSSAVNPPVETAEVKKAREAGEKAAKGYIQKLEGAAKTRVELWAQVIDMTDSEESAKAYIVGYAGYVEARVKAGGADEVAAAKQAGEEVSRMKRIVRAVYGWMQKQTDNKMLRVYGKGWETEGKRKLSDSDRAEKALGILNGPGTWNAKLDSFPVLGSGQGTKSNKGSDPIQKRISAGNLAVDVAAKGSELALADVMAIPAKVKGKPLTEAKRSKGAKETLLAGVKVMPEEDIIDVLMLLINRACMSSIKGTQEIGFALKGAIKDVPPLVQPAPAKATRKAKGHDEQKVD